MGDRVMPTLFDDVDVKCPFFKASDKRQVTCEGITDDCIIKLVFFSEKKRNSHHRIFCCENYKKCEIYRMLEEKYAD